MVVKKEFVLTLTYTHNDRKTKQSRGEILAVTNEIIELKMLKPQTQEIKLSIQRLQQRLK